MKVDDKQVVSGLLEGPLRDQNYELADVVVSKYRTAVTVRLFVYGENGVTIAECARLSRLVGDILDGAGLFENGYALEVSSPGLDRPLSTPRDYRYRIGETVRVLFQNGRDKLTGEIVAVHDNLVEFKVDDDVITIDLADVKQAQIVF
jgi:ribosome maturation factor RimP